MNDEAQKAFAAWVNQQHPNGKSLADVFEPAFGMIAENAWADAWQAATLTERERCAGVCDKIMADNHYTPAFVCADAIRRGEP